MKKRGWIWAALALSCYALLLALLLLAERGSPQSGIRSLGDALWYSLVTLATVGYGDLYPVTPLGRAVGLLFVLLSVGALAAVLGAAFSLLRSRALPWLQLRRLSRSEAFIFSEYNAYTAALAQDLRTSFPAARMAFCRAAQDQPAAPGLSRRAVFFSQSAEEVARGAAGPGQKTVFLMGADAAENYAAARSLSSLPLTVYCRGAETGDLPQVRFFDLPACAARAYWQAHPLQDNERDVLLAGDGALARALLDHAVLVNCRLPFRRTVYHLYGDWTAYRLDHPGLSQVFSLDAKEEGRDALLFHDTPWNARPELLESGARIIFCGDDPAANGDAALRLTRLFPFTGQAYAAAEAAPAPCVPFGAPREICTRRIVLEGELDRQARMLHALYTGQTGQQQAWETLSPFMKASNRASADHLLTKLRLLLPEENILSCTPENCARAAEKWLALPDREDCRRCEHHRWMRFYALYNWRYGPQKDAERRLHPCLVPYAQLSLEDQEKDDNAWQLMVLLSEKGGDAV